MKLESCRLHVLRNAVGLCLAAIGAIAASGCGSSSPPAAPPARWHVSGGFLRDRSGRAVVLRGANVAGAHKLPPYFGFHQPADYRRMRDAWGMSSVRFLISWAAVEPRRGEYDARYLDAVAERIGWARDAGLLVVLDMHQDVYGEGFASGGGNGAPRWTCDESNYASFKPTEPWFFNNLSKEVTACYDHFWSTPDLQEHYIDAWKRVAARLASYDNVVGFDVMNEPYWGSKSLVDFEADVLQPFYEKVVPAVRSVAPSWVAFLEPSSSRNLGGSTRLSRFPFSDVVYAPHSYDRDAESGLGFDATRRAAVLSNLAALAAEAKALDAALWIGEYGGRASHPGIKEYMAAQYDGTGAAAAGAMYWAYDRSDGYALLAPDGAEKKELLDAIVRPYPERVAGDPASFAFDAGAGVFTFTYRPDRRIAEKTILVVPDRVYPAGYQVDCGGCASTKGPGSLTLDTPPPGDVAIVTLRP
jgi:endoglycosylceramidase